MRESQEASPSRQGDQAALDLFHGGEERILREFGALDALGICLLVNNEDDTTEGHERKCVESFRHHCGFASIRTENIQPMTTI